MKKIIKKIIVFITLAGPFMAFASIGTVLTIPSVNVPNSSNDYASTTFKGQVANTGTDPKYWRPNGVNNVGFGYFRYSKIDIPPIFCNDIYGSNMRSTKEIWMSGVNVNFNFTVTDLEPNTKYAYCAVVSNDGSYKPTDIQYGGVYVFTTLPCPICNQTNITTLPAEGVTSNSAYLKGDYNSTKPTKTYFEYRKNVSGTNWTKVNNQTNGAGSSGSLNYSLSGLSQMTEYVFRAVIEEKNVCPLSFTGTYPNCVGNGSNGLSCPAGFNTTGFTPSGNIQCTGIMAANSYAAPQYGADLLFKTILPNGGSSSSTNNLSATNGLGYGNTGWTYNSSSANGSSSSTSGGNSSSSNSGGSTNTNGTSGNGTTGGSTSGNGNGANGNPFNGSGTIGGGIFGPSIGNGGNNSGSGNGGFGNGNNGSGNGNNGIGNGTGTGNDGTGLGTGPGTVLPPPKIGDKINPLSDAIVRYHEGVETVFTRQIKNYPGFAALYGYQDGQDLQSFADNLSHTFAQAFGYYAGGGREIRVSIPDIAAYEFGMKDDTLAVYEYYGGYLTGIAVVTDKLKNKYGYEYYFQKH